MINTNRAQGVIGGDVNIESLQDTAIYDSDQKNMGFSADLDLAKGTGSSLSVNGGKTDINADYKAVGQQSGIFTRDEGAASGVISLALLGAGSAAGLDTASTVTATNVDANNRQLHWEEADLIKSLAPEFAQEDSISIEEAEKRLTRGALYNIDAGWKKSIDTYMGDEPEKIAQYQEAYGYLRGIVENATVSNV